MNKSKTKQIEQVKKLLIKNAEDPTSIDESDTFETYRAAGLISEIFQVVKAAEERGELKGVGKILDSLWDNSFYLFGKLGSDRIKEEMIYYFGKNWMVDMYEFIGATNVHPEGVKTLKELSHKSTKHK